MSKSWPKQVAVYIAVVLLLLISTILYFVITRDTRPTIPCPGDTYLDASKPNPNAPKYYFDKKTNQHYTIENGVCYVKPSNLQ